jgi:hypothetical protein
LTAPKSIHIFFRNSARYVLLSLQFIGAFIAIYGMIFAIVPCFDNEGKSNIVPPLAQAMFVEPSSQPHNRRIITVA